MESICIVIRQTWLGQRGDIDIYYLYNKIVCTVVIQAMTPYTLHISMSLSQETRTFIYIYTTVGPEIVMWAAEISQFLMLPKQKHRGFPIIYTRTPTNSSCTPFKFANIMGGGMWPSDP